MFIHLFIQFFDYSISQLSVDWLIWSLIYSISHLSMRSFVCSLLNWFVNSSINFIHLFIHLLIHFIIHSFINSFIYLFIYSSIRLFINLFVYKKYLLIHSFVHIFINSFINLFVDFLSFISSKHFIWWSSWKCCKWVWNTLWIKERSSPSQCTMHTYTLNTWEEILKTHRSMRHRRTLKTEVQWPWNFEISTCPLDWTSKPSTRLFQF